MTNNKFYITALGSLFTGFVIIHRGRGHGGTILISSWKCNYSIYFYIQVYYMDIQAISTLLCLLLVLEKLLIFLKFVLYKTTRLKSDVSGHFKAYSSHSLQPKGIIYVFIVKRKQELVIFLLIFKVFFFAQKRSEFQKFHKIYYSFFLQKEIIGHTYILTKCIDNFKFSISLKSYEE